jgi:hypothetical protein
MKICVRCNFDSSGKENPCVFHLGARRLPVVEILDRWADAGRRYFEVSVEDGRRFVLRQEPATHLWELAGVFAASAPPRKPAPPRPARPRSRWFSLGR